MKIYAIATETRECYGHNDFATEQRIVRMGPYGSGEFPPAFMTPEAAAGWLKSNKGTTGSRMVVVEIELSPATL